MFEKATLDELYERVRIASVVGGWKLTDEKDCARWESVLWDTLPKQVPFLKGCAWHLLLWAGEDGAVRCHLLSAETRQDFNTLLQQGYIERVAGGSASAELRAWRRAYQQFTRA